MIKAEIVCNSRLEGLRLHNIGRRAWGFINNDFLKELQTDFETNIAIIKESNLISYNNLNARYNTFLKITGNERVM